MPRSLPVLAAIGSTPADWARMAALLTPLATPDTLIAIDGFLALSAAERGHCARPGEPCRHRRGGSGERAWARPAAASGFEGGAVHPADASTRSLWRCRAVVLGNGNCRLWRRHGLDHQLCRCRLRGRSARGLSCSLTLSWPRVCYSSLADCTVRRHFAPLLHSLAAWAPSATLRRRDGVRR